MRSAKRRGLLVVAALAVVAGRAHADNAGGAHDDVAGHAHNDDIVPTLSVAAGRYAERMSRVAGSGSQVAKRDLANTRIALGLNYLLERNWLGLGELRGQTSLGLGLVYYVGDWPIQVRQEVKVKRTATRWLALVGGLETGLQLNPSRWSHSYWEVGLAVGVNIGGRVELLYMPAVTVALGSERENVFGGSMRQQIDTGVQPINFALRVHFEHWGW